MVALGLVKIVLELIGFVGRDRVCEVNIMDWLALRCAIQAMLRRRDCQAMQPTI